MGHLRTPEGRDGKRNTPVDPTIVLTREHANDCLVSVHGLGDEGIVMQIGRLTERYCIVFGIRV